MRHTKQTNKYNSCPAATVYRNYFCHENNEGQKYKQINNLKDVAHVLNNKKIGLFYFLFVFAFLFFLLLNHFLECKESAWMSPL